VAEDYYALLGLEPGADDEEIRKAWKRLALEHHPDRGGRDDRFLQISIAYDILSDPKLKAEYDRNLPPKPVEPIGKRAPGVLIHRLSGTLTTLLSSGAAKHAETSAGNGALLGVRQHLIQRIAGHENLSRARRDPRPYCRPRCHWRD
jgi:curved DNA-binding protein CbpA